MKINLSEIINRINLIILNPKTFWNSQKGNNQGLSELFGGYFLPLLLVTVLAVFLGEFFRSTHFYAVPAVLNSLIKMVLFVLTYFISAYFINILMKTFGAEKNINVAHQLVAYSLTPLLLISIFTGLIPYLKDLNILGLYGFYIFWIGVTELLDFPDQKRRESYILITLLIIVFIFYFLSLTLKKLLEAYF